ncbi:hypothetical protein AN641_01675 [Candidatus Epulonipiscioides gigas]|nr:hypothetical protein AN641_01675 [Epulopiscium sp. SCG-C07WGA-EpuloA2]
MGTGEESGPGCTYSPALTGVVPLQSASLKYFYFIFADSDYESLIAFFVCLYIFLYLTPTIS